jgi:SAM-dependent methyltransferase
MNTARTYLLDNAQAEAARRMQVLARLYDATTRHALESTGIAAGWRCLEVGGGGGTIARWMAERVAPAGSVLATDIDPRHMPAPTPQLRIERHDIVRDVLPAAQFDLIHARLVLIHLPEREAVLARLLEALKPGGWLVIEDYDVLSMLPDASINPHEIPLATAAAMRTFMNRGGVNARCGRLLHGQFRALGLREVRAEGRVLMFDARNGGAELMRVNFEQVGAQLVAGKLISEQQLHADLERLDRDDFAVPSPVMWTVAGRKS